jgi:ankyrin repeat protein
MTPLHHACKFGLLTVVKLILGFDNAKKTINARDDKGWTPLVYAIYSQDDGGPEVVGK